MLNQGRDFLLEITEVEITRVDRIYICHLSNVKVQKAQVSVYVKMKVFFALLLGLTVKGR